MFPSQLKNIFLIFALIFLMYVVWTFWNSFKFSTKTINYEALFMCLVTKEQKLSGWTGGHNLFEGPHVCKAQSALQPIPEPQDFHLVFWAVQLWSWQHCSTCTWTYAQNINRHGISELRRLGWRDSSPGAALLHSTPAARKLPEVSPALGSLCTVSSDSDQGMIRVMWHTYRLLPQEPPGAQAQHYLQANLWGSLQHQGYGRADELDTEEQSY